jgi:hypothetical protein
VTAVPRAIVRAAAAAIAAMGVVDPALTESRPRPAAVDIAVIASRFDRVPAADGSASRIDVARRSAQTIARALGDRAVVHEASPLDPLPCAPARPCVIITDGADTVELPADLRSSLSVVRVGTALSPNVAIVETSASSAAHLGAEAMIQVTLRGAGVTGLRTMVRVTDNGAIVGQAAHTWSADGELIVPVSWWPLVSSPRVLRVTAEPLDLEASSLDNSAEVGIAGTDEPMPVLAFDARPSWASVFVRRALEADPRLRVGFRTRLGPTLGAGSEGARLDEDTLRDAQAVVIGGPDSMTASEVDLLERYVRLRSGTLVLLPDRPMDGPIARLSPARWTEHLSQEPVAVGALRASELLTLDSPGSHDRVLASTTDPTRAVVVSFPSGRGRIVVSGAMDAWRFRMAAGPEGAAGTSKQEARGSAQGPRTSSFDRFWQSLIVAAAAAGGPPVSVAVNPAMTGPGRLVEISVERRGFAASSPALLSASASCGDLPPQAIRLWPTGDRHRLVGHFRPAAVGACRIDAVDGASRAYFDGLQVVATAARATPRFPGALDRAARDSGGWSVTAGDEEPLIRGLLALPPGPAEPVQHHPMRSPWWMVPFAACLGVEWWDRRRRGLR